MHRKQKAGFVPAFCFSARHRRAYTLLRRLPLQPLVFPRESLDPLGLRPAPPRVTPESVIFSQIVSATGMDTRRVPKYFREFDMLAVTNR
jgi:hypothetical protein